jgi:hypothetical protein
VSDAIKESTQTFLSKLLRSSKLSEVFLVSRSQSIYVLRRFHLEMNQYIDLLVLFARPHTPAATLSNEIP